MVGVVWFSMSPPMRVYLGFASGAPSAQLAFSLTMLDPTVVVVIDEGLSGGVLGGIVGGVVGVVTMVAIVMWMRYRNR